MATVSRARAKQLLAQAKKRGKTESQARAAVAQELGCSVSDLASISFTMLSSSDCGSTDSSGGSYDSPSSAGPCD